jgi:hypothetical protein
MPKPAAHFRIPDNRGYRVGVFTVENPPVESPDWSMDDTCPCCGKEYVQSGARLYEHQHCINDTFVFECPRCRATWTKR